MGKKRVGNNLLRRIGSGIGPGIIKSRVSPIGPIRKRENFPSQVQEVIPAELAGKYAVWSPDGLRIVGSGSTIEEAIAIASQEAGRLVQRVPSVSRVRVIKRTLPTTVEG